MAESNERLIAHLAHVLAGLHGVEPSASRLCEASRLLLEADGAALTLMTSEDSRMVVAATDQLSSDLEDLQEVVGEGPSQDAYRENAMQVADFTTDGDGRWALMHEHGRRLGFAGRMVAMPLQPLEEPIGVLTAYRDAPDFAVDPVTAGFLGAAVGTALLQDPRMGRQGEIFADVWSARAQIHQATGMIVSQVGVRPEDALALLRGHAFARNATLLDVAQQIVDRHINFRHFTIEGD